MNTRKEAALNRIDDDIARRLLGSPWPDRATIKRRAERYSYWRARRLFESLAASRARGTAPAPSQER